MILKRKIANLSEFVEKIEDRVDLDRIKSHLNKQEKLSDTILLNADKSKESSLSSNLKESEAKLSSSLQNLVGEIETAQKEYLGAMLERSIGNKGLNSRLTAFSREKGNAAYSRYCLIISCPGFIPGQLLPLTAII